MQNYNSKFKNQDIKTRTYQFSLSTLKFLEQLPKNYIYQTIGKQLLRSSTSIGANIIEAQAGSSKRDFTNFISHSLKSANETIYWLNLLQDSIKSKSSHLNILIKECNEIAKILGASMLRLKNRK